MDESFDKVDKEKEKLEEANSEFEETVGKAMNTHTGEELCIESKHKYKVT